MNIEIDGHELEVIVTRKRNLKRMYLRVKEDLNIYISTNYLTREKDIINFIKQNEKFIIKNLNLRMKQQEFEDTFHYLGKKYDIVYLNTKEVILGQDKLFINKELDLNKWLKKYTNNENILEKLV